ncbi:hypothetical protein [Bacillus sp. UMB0728]|uniref:hypothetical protein n=1 Tax=Bacillus sp. UMB0728 TaxID=2066052 RepID=UPI000C788C2C|nr:hypothetical protein [Bacillus sp. UMB0728]PLR70267.1 hypothetical protein CYJ37_24925 [Bacillus sp. UMB0728]
MIKLKDITQLKRILRGEDYDKIIVWKSGEWDLVTSSYIGEQDGETPVRIINRIFNHNLTYKQIDNLVADVQAELN